MKHPLSLALIALSFAACSPDYGGARGTVHGRFVSEPGSPTPERVAIVWNDWRGSADGGTVYATTQEGEISFNGSGFSFDLPGAPPATAVYDNSAFEPNGGRIARGTVVAYSDGNGNGVLDTIPLGSEPVDSLLGVSSSYFGTGLRTSYFPSMGVLFVEGAPPDSPTNAQPGYNILIDGVVVAAGTEVLVPLHPSASYNLYLCDAAKPGVITDMSAWNLCMGAGSQIRVSGGIEVWEGVEAAYFDLFRGGERITDAQVWVNERELFVDPSSGTYFPPDNTPFLNQGANNEVRVVRTGEAEQRFTVFQEGAIAITSPQEGATFRWDQPITLEWTAGAGVTEYLARQSVRFPERRRGRSQFLSGTSATFAALSSDPGATDLVTTFSVQSNRGIYDDNGSNIYSFVYAERAVKIVQ